MPGLGVRVEKGQGVSEEGEQRPFHGPFCAPVRVAPHLNGPISQSTTDGPEPSGRTIAQPSSTSFHVPSGNLTQERKEANYTSDRLNAEKPRDFSGFGGGVGKEPNSYFGYLAVKLSNGS